MRGIVMIKTRSLQSSLFPLLFPHYCRRRRSLMAAAVASSVFIQGRNDRLIFTVSPHSPCRRMHILLHHHDHRHHCILLPVSSTDLTARVSPAYVRAAAASAAVASGGMSMSWHQQQLLLKGIWVNRLASKGGSNGRSRRIDCYHQLHRHSPNNPNGDDGDSSGDNYALQKARAFAPCILRQLSCDCTEAGRRDSQDAAGKLVNGHSATNHHGIPLGFPDQSSCEKVVVAVDVDEVLGNFISALNRFIKDCYSLNHSVSEYYVYEFFKIWNCSRDEADIRVHEFFKTSYFKKGIHPIPGARQALQKLSRFCNLSVVTSRQNAIRDHTIEWIEKHYPGLFQEIHFGNHFSLEGQSKPKSEICRSLGAKILIDDNPRYAAECAEVGMRVLLFDYENSYPWCKTASVSQHPLVTKVHNWKEVEDQLMSWILSS